MPQLRTILALGFVFAFALLSTGCGNDCNTYCRNQGNFIDACLPQFDQTWSDLAEGNWENKRDFIGFCADEIEAFIETDVEEACAEASDDDRKDCENTIRQGTVQICGEHVNDFNLSCTDYWGATTSFTPTIFDPTPAGDDDDSAGDDDDSAGDDDDSAGDDDDSAGDDDDSSSDDDDSAGDDDDDSSSDDDDSASN